MGGYHRNHWGGITEICNIEAGLRGEYTFVSYKFAPNNYFSDDSYDYFDFFPNVRVTLKAGKGNRISLFYNRRIDRPGEDVLRIFPKYDDPGVLKVGNPSLRPQYTQNVELAYRLTWTSGSVFAAAYYKDIKDPYTRVYINPVPGVTIKAYDNVGRATNLGFEMAFDQKITKIWNLSATDIFNTMGIRQNLNANGLRVEYQNYYESQVVSIGAKYKF